MIKKLHDNHPTNIALTDIFNKMNEHNLKFNIGQYGEVHIIHNEKIYKLKDLEDSYYSDNCIETLPPYFQHKLVYDTENKETIS